MLVDQFASDALFIDRHFQVIYMLGNAGAYLQLPQTQVGFNLLEMLEKEKSATIRSGIDSAFRYNKTVLIEQFAIKKGDQKFLFDLKIRPIQIENEMSMALVEFSKVQPPETPDIKSLQQEKIAEITKVQQDVNHLLTSAIENQIRENNFKLNLVLEASQIGIWEWNLQTNGISCDERTKHIFGYFHKEFDQRVENYLSHIHPEDARKLQKTIKGAIRHNTSFKTELRIVWDDQSVHHVIGHGIAIHNAYGEIIKMIGTCMDVTDLIRKDEKISRFGKLIEESYSEIYIFDAKTLKFIDVNLGARKNLGYTMEELSNMTPLDLKASYTSQTFQQLIQPLFNRSNEKITFETHHLRKDRTVYPVLVNLQLSNYECRQVFIAIIQDITSVEEAQKQLQISEERLEFAIKGTSDGVWDWPDMNDNTMWWSPKFYELLGLKDREIESTVDNFRKLIHPEDKNFSEEELERSIKNHESVEAEFRLLHKKEGYKWFRNRAQVFRNKKGNLRMAGAISDIHQRKLEEFHYANTHQRLKKANEYLDNFVFSVAHDLRSPVANLKSLVELLKSRVPAHDPIVSRIDLSVERLEKTLRGMIRILDVQQEENQVYASLSFGDILDKLKKEEVNKIENVPVFIQEGFNVPSIDYIKPYLESIMRNLINNAIKYAKEGEPAKIYVSTQKYQDFIILQVTDNGIGIDLQRFKDKIFKPFERLSHKSSGLGIGLHLIKTIVEKNGGKVEVNSNLNEGTTFKVYLKPYKNDERKKENTND